MAVVWDRNVIKQYPPFQLNGVNHTRELCIKFSYVFLHQVDLILTVLATSAGFSELNPIIKSMLGAPSELLLVKLIIPLFIAWLVPGKFLLPAVLLLSAVVGWNLKELFLLLL